MQCCTREQQWMATRPKRQLPWRRRLLIHCRRTSSRAPSWWSSSQKSSEEMRSMMWTCRPQRPELLASVDPCSLQTDDRRLCHHRTQRYRCLLNTTDCSRHRKKWPYVIIQDKNTAFSLCGNAICNSSGTIDLDHSFRRPLKLHLFHEGFYVTPRINAVLSIVLSFYPPNDTAMHCCSAYLQTRHYKIL